MDDQNLKSLVEVKKLRLRGGTGYPDNYPDNDWPEEIGAIPALKLKDGKIIYGSDVILKKLRSEKKKRK